MAASTKFLPKVGGGTCPNLYKMVFGGVGQVSGFVAYCMKVEETRLRAKLAADQEKQDKQEDPYTIWGPQAYMYPYYYCYLPPLARVFILFLSTKKLRGKNLANFFF